MTSLIRPLLVRLSFVADRLGYSVRKSEQYCWPDHLSLLEGQSVSTIFDVGAHVGYIAQRYRQLFPKAQLRCFEPLPAPRETMATRLRLADGVHIESIALSDRNGTSAFYVNKKVDTSSLLRADTDHIPDSYRPLMRTSEIIQVPTETLDCYCERHQIGHIDILKMDVQGSELSILRGATRMLSEHRIRLIFTEVFFVPYYENQPMFSDISALLNKLGYHFHFFYNLSFNGVTGRLQWGDAIFVHPHLQDRSRALLKQAMRN